jgi:hypothetical protein
VVLEDETDGSGRATLRFSARGANDRTIPVEVVVGGATCATSYRLD